MTAPPRIVVELPVTDALLDALASRLAPLITASTTPPTPDWMAVDEAAEYLRCRPKRVYDLTSQRRIPFTKDGSRTLVRRADLDAYLASHEERAA
jgi:excisionase family DNA binding protein